MANTDPTHTAAALALRAFLRRVFTVLAVESEKDSRTRLADARAFRAVLESMGAGS